MAALLLAATDASKVPFYIAGGVLAVWAVVLAWTGLHQPAFPNNVRGQRMVMAISFVLAALAIGTAIATA